MLSPTICYYTQFCSILRLYLFVKYILDFWVCQGIVSERECEVIVLVFVCIADYAENTEVWKDGSVEGWKCGRMEGWKGGRVEVWKCGRLEGGRLEEWKVGKVEVWKVGRLEGGRLEVCICLNQDFQDFQDFQDKSLYRGLRGEHASYIDGRGRVFWEFQGIFINIRCSVS